MKRGTVVMAPRGRLCAVLNGWTTRPPAKVWVQHLITGLPEQHPREAIRQATPEERENLKLPERITDLRTDYPKIR